MKNSSRLFIFLLMISVILGACNIPTGTPGGEGASLTAAAQTVEAQFLTLTQQAQVPVTPTLTSIPGQIFTLTPPPTLTVPASQTPICDLGKFVEDVTIKDGTVMLPGQAFTKTWRLQNIGVCTWTGYSLVFDSGDVMGGPATKAIGTTPSNGTVDVSVDLTAPATPGNYRGYWRVRSASGVLLPIVNGYQGKSFYVDIKVQNPTPTPTSTAPASTTVNLPYMAGESGLVLSDGSVNALTVAAGDSLSNLGVEAFLSFDISAVPPGATITNASLLLKGGSQVRGDPFATLGCLRAYVQNYGVVDAGDFVPPGAVGAITRWCNTAELEAAYSDADFIAAVQGAVGTPRFQIRLQFKDALTDSDGTIDDVLILAPVTLKITYTP